MAVFECQQTKDTKQLTVVVIPKPSDAHGASAVEERWSRYVDNYVKMEPTGKYSPNNPVFLKRFVFFFCPSFWNLL